MSYMGKVRPTVALTSSDIEDNAVTSSKIIADAVTTAKINDGDVTTAKMATDPTNASNLSSGSVPVAQLGNVDTSGIVANQDDIALLGFKVAANGSLAKYNLVDQTIDAFEDASGVDASGSTDEIRNSGNYYSGFVAGSTANSIHTSTGAATFTAPAGASSADILVVAGGGGGSGADISGDTGGGGGGGGIVHHASYPLVGGVVYDLTVGTGGSTGQNTGDRTGGTGGNSSFNDNAEGSQAKMTALGGGGGSAGDGVDGGSGGGAGRASTVKGDATQTDSGGGTGYGNDGGFGGAHPGSSCGGGGAGAVGVNAPTSTVGGAGGAGRLFSDFTTWGVSGYFGGGGGGAGASSSGAGGSGGGGSGTTGNNGSPGTVNTGGGAGGAHNVNFGGLGGTGTVIIKYTVSGDNNDMTLISNATTAVGDPPTVGDLVVTYTDGVGTATVNTDLKAYISRDGSAYTSAVTLVSQGTTGGHTILTANGVDLSGITSGTSMKWKIETLNQGSAKETRIQAVSLGWS